MILTIDIKNLKSLDIKSTQITWITKVCIKIIFLRYNLIFLNYKNINL